MNLQLAEGVADAVLYEGYVLYPYRASAAKNRRRWQVGLLMPREYAEATGSDPWSMQTECLATVEAGALLTVKVRCLHIQERAIEQAIDPERGAWRPVDTLAIGERQLISWDEAVLCEFTKSGTPIHATPVGESGSWELESFASEEDVQDPLGRRVARIVRRRKALTIVVHIAIEPCGPLRRIRVRIENRTPTTARALAARDAALREAIAGTHTLLGIENGAFVSLLEPPPDVAHLAADCVNERTWPVLVGAEGSRTMILSSPIILYDYPTIAPESPGDFYDVTEIDELLMLRVKTLTEAEKREARATDDRSARIIDRTESTPPETFAALHGAVRAQAPVAPARAIDDWQSFVNPPGEMSPERATLDLGSGRICAGSRVRLTPTHRADTLDLCLVGRTATVTGIFRTLEDRPYVAVALDDDPIGATDARYRRALFFHPDEIDLLDAESRGPS